MSVNQLWQWWQWPLFQSSQDKIDFNIAFQSALLSGLITSIVTGLFITFLGILLSHRIEQRIQKANESDQEKRNLANLRKKLRRMRKTVLDIHINDPLNLPEEFRKLEVLHDTSGLLGTMPESRRISVELGGVTDLISDFYIDKRDFDLRINSMCIDAGFNYMADSSVQIVYMIMLDIDPDRAENNTNYQFPKGRMQGIFNGHNPIADLFKSEFNDLQKRKRRIYEDFSLIMHSLD